MEGMAHNTGDKSRLDVSAIGVWGPQQRSFLDVRVFHPNSPSYTNKPLEQLYNNHEREKKRLYNERVIQVEKGSFTPLVFSTFGGLGPECEKFHQRVAQLISKKTNQTYSKVVDHIRTRIRFSLLRSVLISLRGVRGKDRYVTKDLGDVSYELIPSMTDYDGY